MHLPTAVLLICLGLSPVDALRAKSSTSTSPTLTQNPTTSSTRVPTAPTTASSLDFGKLSSQDPGFTSLRSSTYTTQSVDSTSIASSIISVLNKSHDATATRKTGISTSTSSTSKPVSTDTEGTSSTETSSTSSTTSKVSSTSSTTTQSRTGSSSSSISKIPPKPLSRTRHKRAAGTTTTSTSTTSTKSTTTTSSSAATCTNPSTILYGYTPPSPNDGATFLLDQVMAKQSAANIWGPPGYYTSFVGQYAALFSANYMGYYQLSSYDTGDCADYCDSVSGCTAFNIYFERTPVYVPNNTTCPNPAAKAAVSCALYGSNVDASTALNIGQYKNDFIVVIQGSNGYNAYKPPPNVPNYIRGALGGALDPTGTAYFLTYNIMPTYDVAACAAMCANYTKVAKAAAIGTTFTPCNYFETFNMTSYNTGLGTYCALFSTNKAANLPVLHQTVYSGVTLNLTYSYGYALYPPDLGLTAVTWQPAPTGSSATCAGLGGTGTTVTDYNNIKYTLACGYDVQYFGDIGNATATDFYSCMNLCDQFTSCTAFAYYAGTCYFKNLAGSNRTPQVASAAVDLAWLPSAYAGFSASTIASTLGTVTSSTAWTGRVTSTITVVSGLTVTVLVQTPGNVGTVITTATDSGSASAVSVSTKIDGSGTTTVISVYPTPPATCGNIGVKWAMYSNLAANQQATVSYPAFTPESYKKLVPTKTGTATYMAESNQASATVTVYGVVQTMDTTVIDHTFYVYAGRGTGYYSFSIPYADDIEFVWIGGNAISGWTRANSNLFYHYFGPNSPVTISYYLTGGTYTPVRVLWGNGGGPGEIGMRVWAPDGTYLLYPTPGANAGYLSPHILQAPCNSSLGAAFPGWGKET